MNKSYVHRVARFNAALLDVPCPRIRFVSGEKLMSATVKAALSADGSEVGVNYNLLKNELDVWLAISHELRHVWQLKNDEIDLAFYKKSNEISLAEYNSQPAELDANAWAQAVMSHYLGIRPTFETKLSPEICDEINRRAAEIYAAGAFQKKFGGSL